jgi:hypothetical protein
LNNGFAPIKASNTRYLFIKYQNNFRKDRKIMELNSCLMQRPGTLIKSNGSRQSPEYLNKASTVGHRIHNQIAFPLSFTSTRNKDDFFCGQGPAPR